MRLTTSREILTSHLEKSTRMSRDVRLPTGEVGGTSTTPSYDLYGILCVSIWPPLSSTVANWGGNIFILQDTLLVLCLKLMLQLQINNL